MIMLNFCPFLYFYVPSTKFYQTCVFILVYYIPDLTKEVLPGTPWKPCLKQEVTDDPSPDPVYTRTSS